jgi:hypothetical protein
MFHRGVAAHHFIFTGLQPFPAKFFPESDNFRLGIFIGYARGAAP